jgi:hypothetical protein
MRRDECDRMIELVKELGSPILLQLREILRTGQPRQASGVVGLVSRLDVGTLLELLPARLPEWNRFYHDMVVRQIAFGAAPDRGRTLLELAEILDPLVLAEAVDEIGMSGDLTTIPPLIAMARPGDTASRSAFLQLKAIESLGRLKDAEAVATLREILETKKTFGFAQRTGARRVGDRAAGYGSGMSVGAATALRADGVGQDGVWGAGQLLGKIEDSDSRIESGRRDGHEGRQPAHRERSGSGDFGRNAIEDSRACAVAAGAGQ